MAKNTEKKISNNQLDLIIDSQLELFQKDNKAIITYTVGDKNIDIEVKHLLSVDDSYSFVEGVTGALFDGDNYLISLFEITYYKALIGYFTNIKTDIKNDKLNTLIYCTDILDKIIENINKPQLNDLYNAIISAINFKKENILSTQRQRIEREQDEILNSTQALINVFEKISEGFEDIDVKEVLSSIKNIAQKDEKKIIEGIFDKKED